MSVEYPGLIPCWGAVPRSEPINGLRPRDTKRVASPQIRAPSIDICIPFLQLLKSHPSGLFHVPTPLAALYHVPIVAIRRSAGAGGCGKRRRGAWRHSLCATAGEVRRRHRQCRRCGRCRCWRTSRGGMAHICAVHWGNTDISNSSAIEITKAIVLVTIYQ